MRIINFLFKNTYLKQTILKNTFWNFFTQFCIRGLKFLLIPIATRVLGPEQFGVFHYTWYLIFIFFNFSDFGLAGVFTREFQKHENKIKITSSAFCLKCILWSICFCFICGNYLSIKDPAVKEIYFVIFLIGILNQCSGFFVRLSNARFKTELDTLTQVTNSLICTGSGIWVLIYHPTLLNFCYAYLLGGVISFIPVFVRSLSFLSFSEIDRSLIKQLLLFAYPLMLTTWIGAFLTTSDTLMVKWFLGADKVAYYQSAYKLFEIFGVIHLIIISPLFPFISKFHNERNRVAVILKKSSSMLALITAIVMILGVFNSETIIRFLYGDQFLDAIPLLNIMLISSIIYSQLVLFNTTLTSLNYVKENILVCSRNS